VTSAAAACVACGSADLEPHMRVAGDMGEKGLIPTTDRFGAALGDIVRCRTCGHMQLDAFPAEEVLAEAYGEAESGDYVEEEAGQRATAAWVLERVERHVTPGELLDLGCWVGFMLAEARGRGWSVHGVEPSEFASAFARERLGLEVVTAAIDEAELPAGAFNAVFMGDVIEHLVDPASALDRIGELLAPGGVVALALPDAGSRLARAMGPRWWSVLPTHVQYFTRDSLATLLRRRGFAPLVVRSAPKAFTVRYYLERIGGYSPAVSSVLVEGAESLGVADRMWAPDFRDRMLMIARGPRDGKGE
jgi:SAM-dependent methyltransferase